ncbi:MAG: stage III sporulation AC/AD family protein [Ruminococcus sp.]|nr:stage III sporulation AC/AD family protein [Ruminococcus sp.]
MTGETGTVAVVCVIAAIFAVLLKRYCQEHALFCVIAACVGIGLAMVSYLTPIVEEVQNLFAQTDLPSAYLNIMWKAMGVIYITTIAGDICRDCEETALAQMAELWGRISLVLLTLPMLEGILEMIQGIV